MVFELAGSRNIFGAVLPLARLGATVVLVGSVFPGEPEPVSVEQLVRRCLTLRGVHNYAPRHLGSALGFLESHPHLPFGDLVQGWESLADLPRSIQVPLPPDKLRLGVKPCGGLAAIL